MKTITFFSIKGGTGRSLALSNIASFLASKGKKVGCIDFDILAPGLAAMFKVPEKTLENKISVIDLLLNLNSYELLTNSIIDCSNNLNLLENALFLIPAKPEPRQKYEQLARNNVFRVATMNWFNRTYIGPFCGIKYLDYLFVDARSGLAEESLCALNLAKKYIILLTRLDTQSQNVTCHFLKLLNEYNYRFKKVIIVASNVPKGESEIIIDGYAFYISEQAIILIKKLNDLLRELNTEIDCIIPFDESLLLEHKIMTLDDNKNQTTQGFIHLANIIENLQED